MVGQLDLLAEENDMRATIIATAAFALLSACANPGDCLDGASEVTQGSGEAALFVLPVALVVAGTCAGITAAANDDDATDADEPKDAPVVDQVPAHGSAR